MDSESDTKNSPLAERFYPYEQVFPFLNKFKEKTEILRSELNQVIHENWIDWPERNLYDAKDKWDVFPFFGFGAWLDQNCNKCPETTRLLKSVAGLQTAIYSRLSPGSSLNPHCGWASLANEVLRCHFGLIVPELCGIWVEGEFCTQLPGEWLVFDDSKSHSGFNFSKEQRIVLLLDIKRPSWVPQGRSKIEYTAELNDLIQKFKQIL